MMLYKLIPPSVVTATIQLPASKSISNRALIINALGKGIYPPENLSDCDDTQVMIKALTEGKETIDIMAAGTAMRFLTAYLSVTPGERTITGTARMHADKFYSKTKLDKEKSVEKARKSIEKHGEEGLARFDAWCKLFL